MDQATALSSSDTVSRPKLVAILGLTFFGFAVWLIAALMRGDVVLWLAERQQGTDPFLLSMSLFFSRGAIAAAGRWFRLAARLFGGRSMS